MPLPVLSPAAALSDADLVRLFHRTERVWAGQLGETEQLDAGYAVWAPDLATAWPANRVLDAAVAPGRSAADAVTEVETFYAARGVRCLAWQLSPTAGAGRTDPLAARLRATGYAADVQDVMARTAGGARGSGTPAATAEGQTSPPAGVIVLPARAAFAHARALAAEAAGGDPAGTEAQLRHLDDPHNDALLALRTGPVPGEPAARTPVGRATVLPAGDVGRLDQVYVAAAARRAGVGRLLVARGLEVCARSLFRHVLLSVRPDNAAAVALYRASGFRKVGTVTTYRRRE